MRRGLPWVVVAVCVTAAAAFTGRNGNPSRTVQLDQYVDCTSTAPQNTAIAKALADAAGQALEIRDCIPTVASGGAGAAALTIASGTTIRGFGAAGFRVESKRCVSGTYVGAACSSSADCPGSGTCSGTQFAPTGGSTYTVLKAASGAARVRVSGLQLYAEGNDGFLTCVGGSAAGRVCRNTCTTDATQVCTVDADCPSSGTCTMDTCTGGACTGAAGKPAGAGKVNLLDLSTASSADVESLTLWDVRDTDVALDLNGAGSKARDLRGIQFSTKYPVAGTALTSSLPHVGTASTALVRLGDATDLTGSTLDCPAGICVLYGEGASIQANPHLYGLLDTATILSGDSASPNYGRFSRIVGNFIRRGLVGWDSGPGNDEVFSGNTLYEFNRDTNAAGAILRGTGHNVTGNNFLFNKFLQWKGCGHCQITENFFGHFEISNGHIKAVDPGGGGYAIAQGTIEGNYFYLSAAGTAIDLSSASSAGISELFIKGNVFESLGTGIKFPASPSGPFWGVRIDGNNVNRRTVTTWLDSWQGLYGLVGKNDGASGTDWNLDLQGFTNTSAATLVPPGTAVELVTSADATVQKAGAASTRFVGVSTTYGLCVGGGQSGKNCTANADCASNSCQQPIVYVARSGTTLCLVGSGTVTRGDRLKVDANGKFVTAGVGDHAVGFALTTSTTSVGCDIRAVPATEAAALELSATPSTCSSGNYARGIDKDGNATGCTTAPSTVYAQSGGTGTGNTLSTSTTQYFPTLGEATAGTTAAAKDSAAPGTITVIGMSCGIGTVPGGTGTRTFDLYDGTGGAVVSGVNCTIGSAARSCSATGLSAAVTPAMTLTWRSTLANSPAATEATCTFAYTVP